MSGAAPLIGAAAAPDLHVMTYNIRRRMDAAAVPHADRWSTRLPRLQALLREERPTVLGVQEALADQARAVRDALGASYRFVGGGRGPGGRGEGCPIFYDADRLALVEWRQLALSDTPDEAGSRTWGNLMPRIMVTARFEDRSTGAGFVHVNTHLDPLSGRSRLRSATAIRRIVAAQQLPAIVTGDLNAGASSATVRELLAGGMLADAWSAARARRTPLWGTYTRYRPPRLHRPRWDWIAVTPAVSVEEVAINARRYGGGWPSDHLPVQARIGVPEGA